VRAHILTAATVLFAVWALAALYGALGPALVQALTGSADVVLGQGQLAVVTGARTGPGFEPPGSTPRAVHGGMAG